MDKKKLNVPYKNYLFFALTLAVLTLLFVLIFQKRLPPQIPLFYGAAEGEAQLVSSWGLIVPNVISVFVIIANSTLSSFSKDEFTKKVLILSALVVTLFSVVTTFKIFFLVGSF